MLLNLLNKEEKYNFLDLLLKVNSLDGELTEFEKRVIDKFKAEMGDDINKYRRSSKSTDELIGFFKDRSKTVKNIVYYNIAWSSYFDEFYSVEEHELLDKIVSGFEISNKKKVEIQKAVYADRDLREKIKRIISND